MKKQGKDNLDVQRLKDTVYLADWTYRLANRYPMDPQLALVLGFLLGTVLKAEPPVKK